MNKAEAEFRASCPKLTYHPEEVPKPMEFEFCKAILQDARRYFSQPGAMERHEEWLEKYRARQAAKANS